MRGGARKAPPGASDEDDRDEHEGAADEPRAPGRFRQQDPSTPRRDDKLVRRGLSADPETSFKADILQATIWNETGLQQMFERVRAGP